MTADKFELPPAFRIAVGFLGIEVPELPAANPIDKAAKRLKTGYRAREATRGLSSWLFLQLLDQFRARSKWHKQLHVLSPKEEDVIIQVGCGRMLIPFGSPLYTGVKPNRRPLLARDDLYGLYLLDDLIRMLMDRIQHEPDVRDFYLFLLENQALPGVMLVTHEAVDSIIWGRDFS